MAHVEGLPGLPGTPGARPAMPARVGQRHLPSPRRDHLGVRGPGGQHRAAREPQRRPGLVRLIMGVRPRVGPRVEDSRAGNRPTGARDRSPLPAPRLGWDWLSTSAPAQGAGSPRPGVRRYAPGRDAGAGGRRPAGTVNPTPASKSGLSGRIRLTPGLAAAGRRVGARDRLWPPPARRPLPRAGRC